MVELGAGTGPVTEALLRRLPGVQRADILGARTFAMRAWLKPEQLFGLGGWDNISHALFWSLLANIGAYVLVSLARVPTGAEATQGALFVDVFRRGESSPASFWRTGAEVDGAWWAYARLALIDDGNPFAALPQTCRFVFDGKAEGVVQWGLTGLLSQDPETLTLTPEQAQVMTTYPAWMTLADLASVGTTPAAFSADSYGGQDAFTRSSFDANCSSSSARIFPTFSSGGALP